MVTLTRSLDLTGFKEYLETRVKQHSLSAGTVTTYMGALAQFSEWLGNREPVREICQDYLDKLTGGGKSNSTAATAAHAIKRYFRWMGKSVDIEYPSVHMLTPKYLMVDQIEMMLDECRTPLENMLVRLLFDTGARIKEITNMNISDIDWNKGTAKVMRKGGNEGSVIMQEDTLKAITNWLSVRKSGKDRLFMHMNEQQLSNLLRRIGRRTGILVTPHMMRHSRAIQLLQTGAEPFVVQQVLGHLDIRTTLNVYGKFLPDHLRAMVPSPFDRGKQAG